MRFNHLDVDIPGQDYQFPVSIEGVTGYNNAIVLTQPMHIDDLKYLRDPVYSYGPWLSIGQTSCGGRFMDNPGDPENWSNSYTQYVSEAAWRSCQVHGGQPSIAALLARYAEGDAKGQLSYYDTNNNGVIEYDWGALTGNDADAVGEVRLYFRDDRAGNRYRAPSSYAVQQWNGSAWVDVGAQTRTPAAPRTNYNLVKFNPVNTQRLRVVMTHASGFKTGLTEIKAY